MRFHCSTSSASDSTPASIRMNLLVRLCAERRDKLLGVRGARIEKFNRDVVIGQAKGDLVGRLQFEPEGPAHRRHVNRLRIGTGAAPTAGALDHPAPESDGPDDPVDAERVCPAASLEIACGVLGPPRCVDAAMAAASRRSVLRASGPREGQSPLETAGNQLVAREPMRFVDDALKPELVAVAHNEPRTPADDWLDVVGYCAHGAGTLSGSLGSSAGEGLAGCSAGSAGSSRGTGSSTGSTVKVRSGSPISISPLTPNVRSV